VYFPKLYDAKIASYVYTSDAIFIYFYLFYFIPNNLFAIRISDS